MTELSVTSSEAGGCVVAVLVGEIDITNAGDVLVDLVAVVDAAAGPVVLDWAGVSFCDSSGIATVVRLTHHARDYGVALAVTGLQGRVANVFTLMSLEKVLPVFADVDAAVRALAGPAASNQAGA